MLSFLLLFLCFQEPDLDQFRTLFRQAQQAKQTGDMAGYVSNLKAADAMRPNHPQLLIFLAEALVLNQQPAEALQVLKQVAQMQLTTDLSQNEVFAKHLQQDQWADLAATLKKNGEPQGRAQHFLQIEDRQHHPEDVAYDPKSKRYFVSSIHKGTILAWDGTQWTTFAGPDIVTRGSFGLLVDQKRRILWASHSQIGERQGVDPKGTWKAGLLGLSLDGALNPVTYDVEDDQAHVLGDLTMDRDGAIYLSDSRSPAIYRWQEGQKSLEIWLTHPGFASPQGITYDPRGHMLYLADYSRGIYAINPSDKSLQRLSPPPLTAMVGIDGLIFHRNKLIAIQNGVRPFRVLQFPLQNGQLKVPKVLAAGWPEFGEPTMGKVLNNQLVFVANSPWGHYDAERNLPPETPYPLILKTPLSP